MVATSLLSKGDVLARHGKSSGHLKELIKRGCQVLHEIDVRKKMYNHPSLVNKKFDIIVFNFPHAGHVRGMTETNPIMIRRNKKLIRAFLRSAKNMLRVKGEIHISHRDDYPYCEWELEEEAKNEGLRLKERAYFSKLDYPGYQNKRGSSSHGDKVFPLKDCYTFKFIL